MFNALANTLMCAVLIIVLINFAIDLFRTMFKLRNDLKKNNRLAKQWTAAAFVRIRDFKLEDKTKQAIKENNQAIYVQGEWYYKEDFNKILKIAEKMKL